MSRRRFVVSLLVLVSICVLTLACSSNSPVIPSNPAAGVADQGRSLSHGEGRMCWGTWELSVDLKSGEVEVSTIDPQGHPLSLARLQEGDFFGEISLVTGRPRNASVRVLQPAELVRLAKTDFDQVIDHHPDVLKVLQESLHLRLGEKFKALGIFRDIPAKEGMV